MSTATEPSTPQPVRSSTRLPFPSAVRTVFSLEMRQRLRGKGWYWMLAIWFVVIAFIFVLGTAFLGATDNEGGILFDLVVGFVLLFGLLVAPGLSANAVNGDRAGGTLAILQVTLLTPGQLLFGKWLASWVGSIAFLVVSSPFIFWALALGGVDAAEALVSLLMLAVELGVVCAIGVGVSALAGRPLFSIVITYMLVALLALGTVIVFGLSTTLVMEQRTMTTAYYTYSPGSLDSTGVPEEGAEMECVTQTSSGPVPRTDYITWILAANPFVVVADAVPYSVEDLPEPAGSGPYGYAPGGPYYTPGVMETISQGVRAAQAGPDFDQTCEEYAQSLRPLPQQTPIWPLGLGLQLLLAGVLLFIGRRKLTMPARRLAQGTRIA
ncbi:ABC transporter permease [Arthrobacter agilis]|uniref:ABC transporter permease n=1 Tax=Arthrobacter agilis TaxID=37921 RepID=UPI002783B292|nr:ABC transporter permease subunit [Arthrobacter agilis]MDQ0737002.1 ABC-type transport system involved in multi-copper enzyme maturation permease subunit [Arthrobacter agilis]